MENVYNVYLFHSIQIYQLHYLRLASNSHLLINLVTAADTRWQLRRLCPLNSKFGPKYFVIFKLIRQKI